MSDFKRILNAQSDVPDQRDWIYQPSLIQLKESADPPEDLIILGRLQR